MLTLDDARLAPASRDVCTNPSFIVERAKESDTLLITQLQLRKRDVLEGDLLGEVTSG